MPLPLKLSSLNRKGLVEFVTHTAQLPHLQSLKLTGTHQIVRPFNADLLVKLAEDCPVLHEVSGLNFSYYEAHKSVDHRLQLNRYGRR